MSKVFCPALGIPQVKQQFETLVSNVGESEAYALWDHYKGVLPESLTTPFNQVSYSLKGKQFQKLTAEEKAKTIEQVTKEHRSITALKDLSAKLAHRIGGTVVFQNHPNVDWKGYNQGMKSVLNEAYMTPDTPFHEILAHPIIRAIKEG